LPRTDQPAPSSRPAVVRCILDSLAERSRVRSPTRADSRASTSPPSISSEAAAATSFCAQLPRTLWRASRSGVRSKRTALGNVLCRLGSGPDPGRTSPLFAQSFARPSHSVTMSRRPMHRSRGLKRCHSIWIGRAIVNTTSTCRPTTPRSRPRSKRPSRRRRGVAAIRDVQHHDFRVYSGFGRGGEAGRRRSPLWSGDSSR